MDGELGYQHHWGTNWGLGRGCSVEGVSTYWDRGCASGKGGEQ